MLIILDNAESVLDPQGTNAQEIYTVVEELSQSKTICLCVTSRITIVPRHCKRPAIPALSMEAACDIFYGIYDGGGQSSIISDIIRRLDFHALSISLLATTASHNMWDYDRLAQEWDAHRTKVLRTDYNESLAATIELSLASPTFRELGPNARDLLSVVAFFPRGVNENNIDWLFPTIANRTKIFDTFCILSLAYRSNGFVTMLGPLRDYLCPKDPKSSPLLCATKERYFSRLPTRVDPDRPGSGEGQWITSEDVNVEHLLDVFTTTDVNSGDVWSACVGFMNLLYWHKPRLTVLGPKVKGLPDDHPSKPQCLVQLSWLFESVGNRVEYKQCLSHTLELQREQADIHQVARTLRYLSDANRLLGLHKEGVQQATEALGIYEQLGDAAEQAECLNYLAWLLYGDKQLDAAETAAYRAIDLLPDKGDQFLVCQCQRILGKICNFKGEREKAIDHFKIALGIASSFNWHDELLGIHYSLAKLFSKEGRFDVAHAHIERAKSHAANDSGYHLGRAMRLQAGFWYQERRLEEAKSEVLRAVEVFEKLGAAQDIERCEELLRNIQKE